MYQTVGFEVIELFSQASGIPLYRSKIEGTPKNLDLDYTKPESGDEVEDLYNLLYDIKSNHCDFDAVGTGAIHSTYQFNRVKNV